MVILHFTGRGYGFMAGVTEYVELHQSEEELIADHDNLEEAIKSSTAPGFKLERKYDTDTDDDFGGLPLGQVLIKNT